jgi:hypothetical protein
VQQYALQGVGHLALGYDAHKRWHEVPTTSPGGVFIGTTNGFPLFQNPRDIMKHISEYSRRNLSYPGNALEGVLGILKAYVDVQTYHIAGIPILPTLVEDHTHTSSYLSLSPEQSFAKGLTWTTYRFAERRVGFPSWS